MKASGIAMVLVVAACVCAGMIDTNYYEKKEHTVVAQSGDCIDIIAGRYYKYDDRKISWDEFRHEVWSKNKKALHNGVLWEGDHIIVEVHKKVEK